VGIVEGIGLGEGDGIKDGLGVGNGVVGNAVGTTVGEGVGLQVLHVIANVSPDHTSSVRGGVFVHRPTFSNIATSSPKAF